MTVDYRQLAKEAFARAEKEIASGDPFRLRYAALELRETMEAITYNRAASYKDQLPEQLYSTWQPRRVLDYLAEIDPRGTFASSTLSAGIEEERGKPAKKMMLIGTEVRLTIQDLKAQYNALGFFLHISTINQINKGKTIDIQSLKRHCMECVNVLDPILKSRIWNCNIGQFVEIECQRCKTSFRWQYDADATEPMRARCIKCDAIHLLYRNGDKIRIEPDWQVMTCPTTDCKCEIEIWRDQMRPGTWWKCDDCGKSFGIALSFRELSSEEISHDAT